MLVGLAKSSTKSRKCNTLRVDEAKLRCPKAIQAFEAALDVASIPPWHVPVDVHYCHWVDTMRFAAKKHLTDKVRRPAKPFLSDDSWAIVRTRALLKQGIRRLADSDDHVVQAKGLSSLLGSLLSNAHCVAARNRCQELTKLAFTLMAAPFTGHDHIMARMRSTFKRLRSSLQTSVAQDKVRFLENCC